jgi:hypothetical protein
LCFAIVIIFYLFVVYYLFVLKSLSHYSPTSALCGVPQAECAGPSQPHPVAPRDQEVCRRGAETERPREPFVMQLINNIDLSNTLVQFIIR